MRLAHMPPVVKKSYGRNRKYNQEHSPAHDQRLRYPAAAAASCHLLIWAHYPAS